MRLRGRSFALRLSLPFSLALSVFLSRSAEALTPSLLHAVSCPSAALLHCGCPSVVSEATKELKPLLKGQDLASWSEALIHPQPKQPKAPKDKATAGAGAAEEKKGGKKKREAAGAEESPAAGKRQAGGSAAKPSKKHKA